MNTKTEKAVLAEETGSKKIIILQALGLLVMGIYSMFCTHFHRFFAKIHITIPGAELPLFIGEILLGFCLILLIVLWRMTQVKFNKWYLLLFFAFMFIFIKAIYGYYKWGGLAFRNAALFYYSFFAVAGYHFYNRKIFNKNLIIILLGVLLLNRFTGGFYDYFISTYLFLSILLVLKIKKEWLNEIKNQWLKFICLTILFVVLFGTLPYAYFFSGTRTITVGNCAAIFFVAIVYFFKYLKIKRMYKLFLFATFILVINVLIFQQKGQYSVRSMFVPKELITAYKEMDAEYKRRLPGYQHKVFKTKLYSTETMLPIDCTPLQQAASNAVSPEQLSVIIPVKLDAVSNDIGTICNKLKGNAQSDNSIANTACSELEGIEAQLTEFSKTLAQSQRNIQDFERAKQSMPKQKKNITVPDQAVAFMQIDSNDLAKAALKNMYEIEENIKTTRNYVKTLEKAKAMASNDLIYGQLSTLRSKVADASQQIKTLQKKYEAEQSAQKQFSGEFNNILWRLFAWRDMYREIITAKAAFGIDFGKPFRSETLEILRWGDGEWVGWLEPHNSYVHVLYRAGIAGVIFISFLVFGIVRMAQNVIFTKSYMGIFLVAIIIFWFTAAFFSVILELPYYAIPFWSLFGLTYGYCKKK